MIKYENQCCGCATETYPCLGSSCPNRNVKVYVCDNCHQEVDILYSSPFDDDQLCETCVLGELDIVD